MLGSYASNADAYFGFDPAEPVMESIFQQYERILVQSLVTSFGLDFLLEDQHGGDVDTIHNVRQIDRDDQMVYKNERNRQAYEQRGEYDKAQKARYDSDQRFKNKGAELKRQKKEGTLTDAYTGQKFARNAHMEVDHVIATKEIHDDRGRVLAGLSGLDLANSEENLQPTDRSINRSMKEKSINEYCAWLKKKEPQRAEELRRLRSKPQSELTDKERSLLHKYEQQTAVKTDKMAQLDTVARNSYEAKLGYTYYTSTKFAKDLTLAAGKVGVRMGARQVLGLMFAEMWFAVKEEFQKVQNEPFDVSVFLKAIGNSLKRGFERAKKKYGQLFSRFFSGTLAGVLSSLTTTLCNVFVTTEKNVVRIIRQSYPSMIEAGKVLFINPDNYTFGERMRAVTKILAAGASIVAGLVIGDAIGNTGIKAVPELCDIVSSFCGAFVSGIMSCTLLYFLDRSEFMNRIFHVLDGLHTIETEIGYYRQQADYFERYAAELAGIDLVQFKKETAFYCQIAERIDAAETSGELNKTLKDALKNASISMPWGGDRSFDQFMGDKNTRLVFG